jgi:hypothetical protein
MISHRPASRRSARSHRDQLVGAFLVGIALLLAAGLIVAYIAVTSSRPTMDSQTHCPAQGASTVTAILFDRTDPINDKQKLFLKNKLDDLRDSAQKFEEGDTYSLQDQGDNLVTPLLEVCNPGKGADVDPITGSPVLAQERWRKQFDAPLADMMSAMREGGGAKTSAILEAVQSVSLQSFQRPQIADKPRKLVLISDRLQFTRTLDFYKSELNYRMFRNSTEALRLHTNLARVAVGIFFIPRAKQDRIRPLINFWTEWFIDQGARQDSFRIIWVEG